MINPPISELMKRVDSRYTLCSLVGKRARQLQNGDNPLVKCNSVKPVTIASYEVNEGKISYVRNRSSLKKQCSKNAIR
jgi:DNA-directed RNA polymerase subunit omega